MKTNTYKLILILCFFSVAIKAQFNTAVYKNKNQSSTATLTQNEKTNAPERKNIRKPLIIMGKGQMKKDLDSIKKVIFDLQKKEEKSKLYRQIQDSVINALSSRKQKIEARAPATASKMVSYKMYDLINQPESDIPVINKISMPLNRFHITSGFGSRVHPIFGHAKMHNGIDLSASYEDVFSVMDGIISDTGWDEKGGGNYIKVRHGAYETSYLHLNKVYYATGELVKAGYIIGQSGNSGNSTGPHLHFAVKERGEYINPVSFLNSLIKANNLIAQYGKFN